MNRQIPIYFDSVVVSSPFQGISETNPNLGRLKVRVFTRYGNRNGSYITDAVAEQLIKSATTGTTPVVGFFDPETQSWASHSGPTLANAYGYVESFLGWEPFEDTDGITREYSVFSVVLFTDYFEEANKIFGQYQSMELNPETISGDWTVINGQEYFVYTSAEMLGFCIIGEHEPCFSVSSFFSKNDDSYNFQYEKFSSLLFNLKAQVEEAEKANKGGEQQMNEFENQEMTPVIEEVQVENPQTQEDNEMPNFQASEESVAEVEPITESNDEPTEEFTAEAESEPVEEASEEPSEFEALQLQFNELQSNYETALARIKELEESQVNATAEMANLRAENEGLQTALSSYEKQVEEAENERKNVLIEKYEKVLDEEEIKPIKDVVKDFSYDELETKLAVKYANKHMAGSEEVKKVPLPETPESQFATFMAKYRK